MRVCMCRRALLPCCARSKDCEVLAEKLNSAGITAAYYHADMEPGTRAASHCAWSEGHVKVWGVMGSLRLAAQHCSA